MREVEDAITSLERNKRMLEMQTDTYKQEGCNELLPSFLEAECAAYDVALSSLREQIVKRGLAELEDAEEQGLLVRLPCKVGDTIFSFRWSIKNQKYEVCTGKVKNVRYDSVDSMDIVTGKQIGRAHV